MGIHSVFMNWLKVIKMWIPPRIIPKTLKFFFFIFTSWSCCKPGGILVPWPGMNLHPPIVEAQSLNHRTAREVPPKTFLRQQKKKILKFIKGISRDPQVAKIILKKNRVRDLILPGLKTCYKVMIKIGCASK